MGEALVWLVLSSYSNLYIPMVMLPETLSVMSDLMGLCRPGTRDKWTLQPLLQKHGKIWVYRHPAGCGFVSYTQIRPSPLGHLAALGLLDAHDLVAVEEAERVEGGFDLSGQQGQSPS